MMAKFRLGALTLLLLLLLPCSAQEGPVIVKLTIRHDGQVKSVPRHVTLTFDNHSARISVRDDKFEVPAEFLRAKKVTFATLLDSEQVRISNLSGREFKYEAWTLLLADHDYDEDYRSSVPKGADIRSSCILVLESVDIDPGAVVFQTSCRSNRK